MEIVKAKKALKFSVDLRLSTPLMIRSGKTGDFTDSEIERCGEGKLHINGYVWASLMRRCLSRIEGAEAMSRDIGDYEPEKVSEIGVSPFWCEASFVELQPTDIRPGIKVDRAMGAVSGGALYSDEIVSPGYNFTLNFNYFCEKPEEIKKNLLSALWVLNEGIENIGGGWSYGYGRLKVQKVRIRELNLCQPADREILWKYDNFTWESDEVWEQKKAGLPAIRRQWEKIRVSAKISKGQLLCIATTLPPSDLKDFSKENFPDAFVFRRSNINGSGKAEEEIVITGKAIRQALFSVPVERMLRTQGENVCLDSSKSSNCECKRCQWFGSVDSRGRIAIADAPVSGAKTAVLNRIQLCEHSMQNMNLFTGEFLSNGRFEFDILIDRAEETESKELLKKVLHICEEIKKEAPPGWHRIGGTSTCTGQIEIKDYTLAQGG